MNYLDLFAGVGGFALGAYWAGWRFDKHYFSEVDDYAIRVYQQRFPEAINLGDITKIMANSTTGESRKPTEQKGREDISRGGKKEWIITGGFPCQDISCAGKREGITGSRSGLWSEMWRIIGILRPHWVIAENVGALTIRGLDRVLADLAEIGYDAEWQDIRASDVGAPHRRERIWIVAYSRQLERDGKPTDGKGRNGKEQTCTKISSRSQDVADTASVGFKQGTDERREISEETRRTESYFGNYSSRRNQWSVEPDVGRVANGVPKRVDRLKCLGNAIVPQIAEILFQQIAEVERRWE